MRRLWTERTVNFDGADEQVTGAGLAPLPVQRPIPVWFGAASRPAYERAGRLADGWFPQVPPGHGLEEARAIVEKAASDLRSLDSDTRGHTWKHAMKKAGEGPAALRELRATVPHRA